MTLKEIKNTSAQDITTLSFEDCKRLYKSADLSRVATSRGIYGVNGAILQDRNTGELYKITARNSVLSFFI